MAVSQGKEPGKIGNDATATAGSDPRSSKIDRRAPAGSENSLGAESVRDGRPATDDGTVEAIDEEGPGVSTPPDTDNGGS
jgi:hypothetical protein